MTAKVKTPVRAMVWEMACTWCGAGEDEPCRTPSGQRRPVWNQHADRWDALRAAYRLPRRYTLKDDDPRFGLTAGDVLVCQPYWLDPGMKLTVLYRERDGFDPQCNVYRADVRRVPGSAGRVDRAAVPA